ncbi:PREDICTED: uncharacterized protein LOC107346626 [Acropora digitifera]|uniref:uncharacterized protein LOC107346626 n=1 Tax=Acropora digitifera TaxID=70779 RepID=UPI00077A3A50|nr:PREDICTED: uncharacterized protein LOC107346626 [Acropora digitifera]
MAGLYSRIVHALWFKRDQDNSATCHQQGVLKVRKRVTLMVVVVKVIFAICWGMDSVMHLIADVISYDIGPLAIPIAHTMIMFNSAVNPFANKSAIQAKDYGNVLQTSFKGISSSESPLYE